MNKTLQAKHVDEQKVLALIDRIEKEEGRWTLVVDLEKALELPRKVILAKMAALIKRKVIGGCACGCRGDYSRLEQPAPVAMSLGEQIADQEERVGENET